MPSTVNRSSALETRIEQYVVRRSGPIAVSVVFIVLGLLYAFRWSAVVRHRPSLWIMPSDLWTTYGSASAAVHGHFASIYGSGFLAFPGFLLVLAPVAALSGRFDTAYVQIMSHGHPFTGTNVLTSPGTPTLLVDGVAHSGDFYAVHQGVFFLLMTYVLVLSCTALFAFDALAAELGVVGWRRAVLAVAEGALLWVVVMGGHPEDALSVALATWGLLWAFRRRWTGAGWLFGVAVAVQPLVIVVFPLLLALGGRGRVLGLVVRGAVPAAVVIIGPLAADAHDTLHALVEQPTFPNVRSNFRTAWMPLAPYLNGSGQEKTVGGGPVRVLALALAAGLGWWSVRWRDRHQLIAWAVALALALRVYTESVMTAYYSWPALALGLVVACRARPWRFMVALGASAVALVVGQWQIADLLWWAVQVVAVTVVLVATASPMAPEPPEGRDARRGPSAGRQGRTGGAPPPGAPKGKRQPAGG